MNVFELRQRLVDDYGAFIASFFQIAEPRVREHVEQSLAAGLLWPDPLIQLNPSFEPGEPIDDLVRRGVCIRSALASSASTRLRPRARGGRLQATIDKNREALKAALLPRVRENPPPSWTRADGSRPEPYLVEKWLDGELRRAFGTVDRLVGDMKVKVVFKGVTYDTLKDPQFIELAKKAMPSLEKLHQEYEAARASEP